MKLIIFVLTNLVDLLWSTAAKNSDAVQHQVAKASTRLDLIKKSHAASAVEWPVLCAQMPFYTDMSVIFQSLRFETRSTAAKDSDSVQPQIAKASTR